MDPNTNRNTSTPKKDPLDGYQLTPEEQQVLSECNLEAMVYRAMPLSIGLGASTWYAFKAGIFKANPKLGAIPKVMIAVASGYLIGYASYMPTCNKRFMALPNSPLAAILRQRGAGIQAESEFDLGNSSEQLQSSEGARSRLSLDRPISSFEPLEAPKSSVMFEPLPSESVPFGSTFSPGFGDRPEEKSRGFGNKGSGS